MECRQAASGRVASWPPADDAQMSGTYDPALETAFAQFRWASDQANAVLCRARDVRRLERAFPALAEAGTLRLYQHRAWPCVYVTLVATVVGATQREGYSEYIGAGASYRLTQWTTARRRSTCSAADSFRCVRRRRRPSLQALTRATCRLGGTIQSG